MSHKSKGRKNHADHTRHNFVIAILFVSTSIAIISNLIFYRAYKDLESVSQKTAADLKLERLKREYFEWRDSNASGHTVDKSFFPKKAELEALQAQRRQGH